MGPTSSREDQYEEPVGDDEGLQINPRPISTATESEYSVEEQTRLTGVDTGGDEASPDDDASLCEYHDIPPPPDGGYGWVVVFASFMCNMIVDGIAYTFGIFFEQFVIHFGESKGKTAWVGSLLSGMYLSAVCMAGSFIAATAFVLSTFVSSVNMLMLVYGVMGGVGFGLIYLPAVVCVGYYFETKRSLATGIAVCGSGFGTFAFAPLANFLIDSYSWKGAHLILAGLILNCAVFGALMRPLEYQKPPSVKPLLQRMAEEKRFQMERGSIGGSYFMVQLPDGSMEKRMKMPINIDPGVQEHSSGATSKSGSLDLKNPIIKSKSKKSIDETANTKDSVISVDKTDKPETEFNKPIIPRNASQPAFTTHVQGLPKNGSVPFFDRIRKTSTGERYKPSLSAIKNSRNTLNSNGDIRKSLHLRFISKSSKPKPAIIRPLSRKDIFYSGSIVNLPEYQSQKSIANYRQSVISLPKSVRGDARDGDMEKGPEQSLCPCLELPESFKEALGTMLDMSLLRNPVFLLIGISNVFGMAGLYVPFFYLVDSAIKDGVDHQQAPFLLSIIGITNTVGRVICGFVADFPQVNSLLLNNICLLVSTLSVAMTPFWLDKLTNAFGLLILFRGAAAIMGAPIAGSVYDATGSYSIPFFMAAFFFLISTITSFMAPALKRCTTPQAPPVVMDALTPIDEDIEEENEDDIPEIIETAPSPSDPPEKEIKQIESVL
ncbi:hypothetical protein G9C98_002759 [Cotesia typhae]|uniref:Monocarboxylate transporter 3 n=1 Tax=Cotesia typhae TaxID=2053667 RepID=A0A8J5RHJ2_9HYME|nr:hypothetical protein G9C98_002759 [Cotesia typhae]